MKRHDIHALLRSLSQTARLRAYLLVLDHAQMFFALLVVTNTAFRDADIVVEIVVVEEVRLT